MTDQVKLDYSMARPAESFGPWERVLEADCPLDPQTLQAIGPDDCFKLEYSGWTRHVIFKPEAEAPND
jgi:hypothetical protein